jgi:WD40 repeat protein
MSVAWSSDGHRLASSSYDNTVRVWDTSSGHELCCLRGHESSVTSVAWCGDGRRLASGSRDKTVRVWDSADGKELLCLCGHEDEVYSLAWSNDSRRIASGSKDRTVRVWDASSAECVHVDRGRFFELHAIAQRTKKIPFIVMGQTLETTIQKADTLHPIAWLAEQVEDTGTHPSGRSWGGRYGTTLCLFALEGNASNDCC